MKTYETVIGLEIHAELSTKTKAFCGCSYRFGGEVNSQCCPVCLSLPGALPVLNKMVPEYAVRLAIAAGGEVQRRSSHARKNYFYPDLPKGYQVTQSDIPICVGGSIEYFHKGERKAARLTRIHIEEDTAKLIHDDSFNGTLLDFNRCGVPLIEIVTEPDFRSSGEVKDFFEAVRTLLGVLNICNGRMQEGVLRADVNVSVRPAGQAEFGTRVEMKNINSFSGAVLAIEYESARQIEILENGNGSAVLQETRRWDEGKNISIPMRAKDSVADYRYFTDMDLASIVVDDEWLAQITDGMPELPIPKFLRYRGMGIPEQESRLLVENADKAAYFEECVSVGGATVSAKSLATWVFGDIQARINKLGMSINDSPVRPVDLCRILGMFESGEISINAAREVLDEMFANGGTPDEIVKRLGLVQVNDEGELKEIVASVLAANDKSVADYKNGKSNALAYLVGQCMKASKGKANPVIINRLLLEQI
ncbi:MAG: Asp-tRNA(Asn)/Glu-tRNA(Gln) amidotransferase subunit GatB [Defluviitaleaceae bacterium]|nr:Asp-tRNA(Asn)/Glu-tRNA(Gln) amidotransferase subunit GatB [Defluviitaleaceae bacterium]